MNMKADIANLIIEFHFKDKDFDETFGGFEIDPEFLIDFITPKDTDKTSARINEFWRDNILDHALQMLIAQDVSHATEEHIKMLLSKINIKALLPNDTNSTKALSTDKALFNLSLIHI